MPDNFRFELDKAEVDSILKRLKFLSIDGKYKRSQFALRKAADVIVAAAKRDVQAVDDPRTRNKIYQNVVRSWSRRYYRRTGNMMYRVGILGGSRVPPRGKADPSTNQNPGRSTFYWRFVNFGFTPRGRSRRVAGKFFFGKQLAANSERAIQVYLKTFSKGIDNGIRLARRRASKA